MNSSPSPPGSSPASPPASEQGFRCLDCGRPLVWHRLPPGPTGTQPDELWETAPQVPPGMPVSAATEGWVCVGAECRRVYLVGEGIPSFLRGESGVMTMAAHAGASPTRAQD